MKFMYCIVLACLSAGPAQAWDGYDSDTGAQIQIDRGNLIRRGSDIEYYDSDTGAYRSAEVQTMRRFGSSVEVEVDDAETGETRTFEMDGND